jgi:hypothetical protein
MGPAILCFIIAGGLVFLAAKPHTAWRLDEGWRYRNPDAVEPSDAYLSYLTVGYVVGAIALAILGVMSLSVEADAEKAADCEETMEALEEAGLSAARDTAEELGARIEVTVRQGPNWGEHSPPDQRVTEVWRGDEKIGEYTTLMGWSSYC